VAGEGGLKALAGVYRFPQPAVNHLLLYPLIPQKKPLRHFIRFWITAFVAFD